MTKILKKSHNKLIEINTIAAGFTDTRVRKCSLTFNVFGPIHTQLLI